MKFLLGRGGLPRFKIAALADALGRSLGTRVQLSSRELLMLDLPDPVWSEHSRDLRRLLDAEPLTDDRVAPDSLFVVPRRGMLSPWASKAADILLRCHIEGVRRIERGWWIRLDGIAPGRLDAAARDHIAGSGYHLRRSGR